MAKTSRIQNTLEGRKKRSGLAALMTPKMIISLVLIGIFSFAALVTLSGYAGDMRQQNNGQAHALSRSAIGFGGLTRLLGDMDYDVRMARSKDIKNEDSNALRIITLSRPYQADKLDEMELYTPTLIIMPKWITTPVKGSAGWVQKGFGNMHTFGVDNHERDLKELTGDISFTRIVRDDKSKSYSAASTFDPQQRLENIDIENLQWLKGDDLIEIFRVEEGAGSSTNVIKVLTQPPFLAATLCLLAAGGLIAWQAFSRFGEPLPVQRDYALGKFSLADNAARFIRIAGREPKMAKDYTTLIRKTATYNELLSRAATTQDNQALMRLATDLEHWKKQMTPSHISGENK